MTTYTISRSDIRRILEEHPTLGYGGFPSSLDRDRDMTVERRRLIEDHADEVGLCAFWLSRAPRNKAVSATSPGSYGLKHTVEKACGQYVPNGAAIVAALILGIPISEPEGPNVTIGVSRRWYDSEWKAAEAARRDGTAPMLPADISVVD